MEEYKSNSKNKRVVTEVKDKKVDKIVKGKVTTKKKSFLMSFIQEDLINVKNYIIEEVVIPTAKAAITDIVSNGINMLIYGEAARSRDYRRSTSDRVSYRAYYDRDYDRERDRDRFSRDFYDLDNIVLESRSEAETVLDRMDEILETYGSVKVAELYDLIGITAPHTSWNYGWTNLRDARLAHTRDGYRLDLPKARPIRK